MLARLRSAYAEERLWEPIWLRRIRYALCVAIFAAAVYEQVEHPSRSFSLVLVVFGSLLVVVSLAELYLRDRWTRGQRSSDP